METRIPTADGDIAAYLAQPQQEVSGRQPWPGVVVVHDAHGLAQDTRNITERFATAGFVSLAPDLFSRGGPMKCLRTVFREMLAGRGRAFDDLQAARRMLMERTECTGKVGVVGFCMGGGFALAAAGRRVPDTTGGARGAGFDASAPYYGQLPKDLSILDEACPIVASFGRKDPTLKGAAATLESALAERAIPHDVKEYPEAGHCFANQLAGGPLNSLLKVTGFGYHHEASEDAWRRVVAFFAEHLR